MANIKDFIKKIGNSAVSLEEQQQALAQVEKTIIEAKQKRTEAVGKNADMVIQALKTIEARLEAKLVELNNTPAKQGIQGPAGQDGKDGKDGQNGRDGISGKDGTDGKDGVDGKDGISVVDAKIDFDGSLVVYLSNGSEIDCGQILQPEVAKNIIISSGGSGTSQVVTDTLVSLQNQINTLTGIDGVLGDMAQQNANAVAITGGTINGTTIGATSATTVNATTLSGQTARLNGTGTNLLLRSQEFNDGLSWGLTTVTVTANSIAAPDGTTTADTLTGGVGTVLKRIFESITITAGTYTFSVYAKAGTHNFIQFFYGGTGTDFADFNVSTGTAGTVQGTSSITSAGNGWYRCTHTFTANAQTLVAIALIDSNTASRAATTSATGDVYLWGAQLELGSTANTYIPTTSAAVYGTPTLSFSGVSTLGLESNGALFLQPAGTGAIQASATTSTATGGNARGSRAVDWQLERGTASQVASGAYSNIGGGFGNINNTFAGSLGGGYDNTASGNFASVLGGRNNTASGTQAFVGGGYINTAAGYLNFIGGGFTNSGTALAAVTTQSGTMNATTAVTLSGSNANIKVGQLITGTSIASETYVAAISGTSLTLSKNASGSSTSTLSFYTPHGVVVGGGNNQATGSYSFIGGGGDGGTAANRNVASGAWSAVVGGTRNTASGIASFIGGGGTNGTVTFANTASGGLSVITGGWNNTASADLSTISGGQSNFATGAFGTVAGGTDNLASGSYSSIIGGAYGTARGIAGNAVFPTCAFPIASSSGVSQAALLILGVQTTDATATALRSNTSAAGTTNQVILPNNSAYYFKGSVIANVTGAANGAAWSIEGAIMRGANAASTVLIDTPSVNRVACSAGATAWVVAVTADTTNGGIRVTVTGVASTTIRWVAKLETTEVTY